MAHWAKVDEEGLVEKVLVTSDDDDKALAWLNKHYEGRWIKTSYNTFRGQHSQGKEPLRLNFASVGMMYLEDLDCFVLPRPYPSWILDETTGDWLPPVEYPIEEVIGDSPSYTWDESKLNWVPNQKEIN